MSLTRSEQMSRIRGTNTSPERVLRSALWRLGLRYRLHARTPQGRPDIVLATAKVAVFIDGCFWHGCPIHYVRPRSREEFWAAKLRENVLRDRSQTLALEREGWRVCRLWEHEVFEQTDESAQSVLRAVRSTSWIPMPSDRVVRVDEIDAERRTERRFIEDLRDPGVARVQEQRRSTRKWSRPKSP